MQVYLAYMTISFMVIITSKLTSYHCKELGSVTCQDGPHMYKVHKHGKPSCPKRGIHAEVKPIEWEAYIIRRHHFFLDGMTPP